MFDGATTFNTVTITVSDQTIGLTSDSVSITGATLNAGTNGTISFRPTDNSYNILIYDGTPSAVTGYDNARYNLGGLSVTAGTLKIRRESLQNRHRRLIYQSVIHPRVKYGISRVISQLPDLGQNCDFSKIDLAIFAQNNLYHAPF